MRWLGLLGVVAFLTSATVHAENREVAREAFHEGSLQYDLGDFRAALAAFKRAYLNFEDPVILFNIGQCQRHLGDKADALRSFRVFLTKVPNSSQRPQVEKLMSELQAAIDQDKAAATRPPIGALGPSRPLEEKPRLSIEKPPERVAPPIEKPPERVAPPVEKPPEAPPPKLAPPEPEPAAAPTPPATKAVTPASDDGLARARRGRTLKLAGVALAVVAVAAIAVGGAFTGMAAAANHDYLHPSNGVYSPSADDHRQLYQTLDVTFFAVGGAALVAGVVSLVAGHQLSHNWSLAPVVAPQQASLSMAGRF